MKELLANSALLTPWPPEETQPFLFTVSSLARSIKKTLESDYGTLRVKGEISGAKLHTSGHLYFSLKDSEAVLDGVCWRPTVSRLGYVIEDGMEVVCTGRLTSYPQRSKYQVVVDHIELAGEGALLKILEDRKKRLLAEGLFSPDRKKPLPFLPKVIGVITSPTGAVIQDILHRLEDRFPCHVILWPVLVQGEGAAAQITAAIEGFNKLPLDQKEIARPDVLIVARGGGSLEDLWAFNEECVVRAVASSSIPIISAVGHETDTTLIDYAADLRAPTPTAAAEKAVPVREHLWLQVQEWGYRLPQAWSNLLTHYQVVLEGLGRGIPSLKGLVEEKNQRLDEKGDRLEQSLQRILRFYEERLLFQGRMLRSPLQGVAQRAQVLESFFPRLRQAARNSFQQTYQTYRNLGQLLESFSPTHVLERGYTLIWDTEKNKPLTRFSEVKQHQSVRIQFYDGEAEGTLEPPLKTKDL